MHDIQELTQKVEQITKCSQENQAFLLRWLSRQQITQKLKIEKDRKKIFHLLKDQTYNKSNELLSYCSLVLSLRTQYSLEKKLSTKNFCNMSLDDIQNIAMIRINRSHEAVYINSSPKRNKLIHYWAVVKMCRTSNIKPMSFSNIAKYLKKFYNFEVGHNLIAQLWRELELSQINKDEKNG